MDFVTGLLNFLIFIIPFFILYFVIAAGVKKGLDSSEVGRVILEKHYVRKNDIKK